LVKIGDFDRWCHAASELVDLVIDLAWRDEKYLRRDGLSTRDNSLRRISDLESQFVNSIRFSTFELARLRLVPKPAPLPLHSVLEQPVDTSCSALGCAVN
jgi:hypothetical protein